MLKGCGNELDEKVSSMTPGRVGRVDSRMQGKGKRVGRVVGCKGQG